MGTKVQSKTYFPGYHSMRDLNNNLCSGMWDLYREDKTLENSQYSFFTRPAIDGYVGYEKQQLRQTILKQESMFRHQLQELHRLYKKQRDLMNECTRKELHNHPMLAVTSKPSLFPSQVPSEDAKETRHASSFPFVDSSFGRVSTSGTDSNQSPLTFVKRKSTLKDCEPLKSKINTSQRRMFDLELPADFYDEGIRQVDRTHDLADLNEPIHVEETSLSASVNNLSSNNSCLNVELRKQDVCMNSNSGFWFSAQEFSQNFFVGREAGICLNDKHIERERSRKEQSTYNFKAGNTRCHNRTYLHGIYPDRSSTLSNSMQVEPRKACEPLPFPITDQDKTEPQRKRTIFGVELCEGNHQLSSNASQAPNLHLPSPQSNVINSESSFGLPWRKTPVVSGQNILAIQDNSCFGSFDPSSGNSISLRQLPEFLGGEMHVNSSNSRSIPSASAGVPLQTDGGLGFMPYSKQLHGCSSFDLGFPSSVNSKNSGTELLGQRDPTANCNGSECVNLMSADRQKHDNHEIGLPWLLAKPNSCVEQIKGKESLYQMNLDSLQNHSPQFFKKAEMMKGPTQVVTQDSTSLICAHDPESVKVETKVCQSVTKILGFPIVNVPDISDPPSCLSKSSDHESNANEVKGLAAENGLNNYISDLRHHIDLNMALNEEESPLAPSFPKAIVKIATTEIDLEAPAVLESEEADTQKSNLMEPPSELPLDGSTDLHEELAKDAAEAIMTISSSSCQSLEATASGLLLWFADVISSDNVNEGLVELDGAFDEERIPEGTDEFEFMTLKLKDAKGEEYCYKPVILENESGGVASVPKQPRKGQGRRGRQRKDFLRDILPSLVSLSRREVTEDLQTFEEVFTALGDTWQSSLSKRKAARNGRGRRRLVDPAPALTATAVVPPPMQQPGCREVALEEKSLSGWGKRTRRLPRQRCTNGNHPLALKC